MKIKQKSLTRLASLSALGAGALGVTTKTAQAGIVYTAFSPPRPTVGFSTGASTTIPIAPGGAGTFKLFRSIYVPPTYSTFPPPGGSAIFRIMLQGLNGMNFQAAPGPGFMWNATAPFWNSAALRSKRTSFGYTKLGSPFSHSTVLTDRIGEFFLLFQFNPTGSQIDNGWLRLNGLVGCGCNFLDTEVVDFAYDDSGALIAAGVAPEPATMLPTGLAALALGAAGIRRWRKARKQAA